MEEEEGVSNETVPSKEHVENCEMKNLTTTPRPVVHLQMCLQAEWTKVTLVTLHHLGSSATERFFGVVRRNESIKKPQKLYYTNFF